MFGDATSIELTPHSRLCLRLVCLTRTVVVLLTRLTTSCVDVRLVQRGQSSKPTLDGVLTGHSNLAYLSCNRDVVKSIVAFSTKTLFSI